MACFHLDQILVAYTYTNSDANKGANTKLHWKEKRFLRRMRMHRFHLIGLDHSCFNTERHRETLRERQRDTVGDTEIHRETQGDTEKDTEIHRETQRGIQRDTWRDTERDTETQRETQKEIQRDTAKDRAVFKSVYMQRWI